MEPISFKTSRFIYMIFSSICDVDHVRLPEMKDAQILPKEGVSSGIPMNRFLRMSLRLSFLITAAVTVLHMSVIAFYQYGYDTAWINLDIINATITNSGKYKHYKELEYDEEDIKRFEQDLWSNYKVLKTLGDPFIGHHFYLEAGNIIMIWLVLACNFAPSYNNKLYNTFFIRYIFNPYLERINCQMIVRKEIGAIYNSCVTFAENLFSICDCSDKPAKTKHMVNTVPMLNKYVTDIRVELSYLDIISRKENEEKLFPWNRRHKSMTSMTKQYTFLCCSNLLYSFVYDVSLLSIARKYRAGAEFVTPMDRVVLYEYLLLAWSSVAPITFWIPLETTNFSDRLDYMSRLRKEIIDSIQANNECYQRLVEIVKTRRSSTKYDIDKQAKQINLRLLKSLIDYKIFYAQFKSIKKDMASIASKTISIAMVLPIVIRLHISYVIDGSWPLATYLSFAGVIFADTLLTPLCTMHLQGLRVISSLNSLMSQAMRINQVSIDLLGRDYGICSEHVLHMYSKELSDPEITRNQFAVVLLGVYPWTPANMLAFHYWFSLALLSAFYEMESWHKLFGDRLHDPLGIIGSNSAHSSV